MVQRFWLRIRSKLKQPVLIVLCTVVSLGLVRLITTEHSLSHVYYAFRLFTTLIHEIGHSVVAIATGGHVNGFVVNASSGGYADLSGGKFIFVLPAGYVGCAIFGSFFFYLSNRYRWADLFAAFIGLFIMYFTVMYGKPEANGAYTAHIVAFGFGLVLLITGVFGVLSVNMIVVNIITTMTAIQGVLGAWALHVNSQQWHHNDAVMFSHGIMPLLSGNQVAFIWAVFSVICYALAFYHGFFKTVFHGGKIKWKYIDGKKGTIKIE